MIGKYNIFSLKCYENSYFSHIKPLNSHPQALRYHVPELTEFTKTVKTSLKIQTSLLKAISSFHLKKGCEWF